METFANIKTLLTTSGSTLTLDAGELTDAFDSLIRAYNGNNPFVIRDINVDAADDAQVVISGNADYKNAGIEKVPRRQAAQVLLLEPLVFRPEQIIAGNQCLVDCGQLVPEQPYKFAQFLLGHIWIEPEKVFGAHTRIAPRWGHLVGCHHVILRENG